jgi:hypothetical protein
MGDADKPRERLTGRGAPAAEGASAPTEERISGGQLADHWVLPEEERAKGFVRPVRLRYRHVGQRPSHETRALTAEEEERFAGFGYVRFEPYPDGDPVTGRYWTQEQLDAGCGAETTMPRQIAETYARDPTYYGSTFCAGCGQYRPVAEFEWLDDGSRVGS